MMAWWGVLLIAIFMVIFGGIVGFFITRSIFKKQLRDNPPINEQQIRAMYQSMGRKPSETDIKRTMSAFKRNAGK